jgi:hypothetical protein
MGRCGSLTHQKEKLAETDSVRTSQETCYVTATEPSRLMLFGETVIAVRTVRNTQIHCVGSPYLTENTLRLRYRAQPVNAVWGNSRCLL